MKRFIRRNIKHIITALLFVVFVCSAIGGIRIRSVQEVRREAQELAGIETTTAPDSQKSGQEQTKNLSGDAPQTGPSVEATSSAHNTDDSEQNGTVGEEQNASSEKKTTSGQNGEESAGKQKSSGTNRKKAGNKKDSSGKNSKTSTGKESSSGKFSKASKEDPGAGQKQTPSSETDSSGRKVSDGNSKKPDRYHTDPVPAGKPEPVDPEDQSVDGKKQFYVYLSIDVKTILDHKSDLKQGLEKYVPEDGWILPKTRVLCYEGETAWDVMSRECKARGIPVQSTYTQFYGSVYMEGINHIGEFDCGATSGWIYEVDGWIPNYSSSRYVMVEGEYLRWRYSCAGFGSDLDGIVKR